MDQYRKAKLYIGYLINQLSLKHDFIYRDMSKPNYNNGWSKPDQEIKSIGFYWTWKWVKPMSYEDFINNPDSIRSEIERIETNDILIKQEIARKQYLERLNPSKTLKTIG